MARRRPVRAFKVYRKGYVLEVKISKVPVSKKNPLGCHFRGREESYSFQDIETLLSDFKRDCERVLEEVDHNETSKDARYGQALERRLESGKKSSS